MRLTLGRAIIGLAAIATIVLFIWYFWYFPCSRLSGFDSDAWGGTSGACIRAGCRVTDRQRVEGRPDYLDTGGESYRCVPKLFP